MSNWSSFENDKLIMESWRRHLNEDIEIQRLSEDLDRELEKLDELFGFGKSREDKWKAIAAGEDEEEPEAGGEEEGEKEEKRGFFGKMADYAKGIKDISGFFGKGAGTLLAGEETFDIKKRNQLKDNAKAEIEKWLTNLNYPPLKVIYEKLTSVQFPNNDKADFGNQVKLVQTAYDTVVSEHKAKKIPTEQANLIIAVMRGMVIYFQDFAIADRYMYVNEQEEGEGEEGTEEEEETMGAKEGAVAKNVASAYSHKLPLGLAAGGAAALSAGFVADSQWFQDWLLTLRDMKETIEVDEILENATETLDLGEVKPGEGVIKVIRRLVPGKENFAKGAAGSDLGFLNDPKHKMVYKLLKTAMGAEPGTDVGAFEALVNSDGNAFETFVSGPMSGRGGTMFAIDRGKFQGQFQKIIGQSVERIKKQPAKTIKNWFIKSAGIYLGPVLKALGLGAIVAAGVSAAMRFKGKRSSRMAQLTSLVDSMLDVTGGDETQTVPPKPGGGTLEQNATKWVAAGKPGHEDPSFMGGKSVSSINLVTRGGENFAKDNPGDPDDILKPDALELAYQQLAWLKANPGTTEPQRNGRASMADDLKVRIQATEKDQAGGDEDTTDEPTEKAAATQGAAAPAAAPGSTADAQAARAAQSTKDVANRGAPEPEQEKCPAGQTRNKKGACVPFGSPGINETLRRWQQLAGILKG